MSKQNVKPTGGHVLFFLLLVLIFGATGCEDRHDMNVIRGKLISRSQAMELSRNFVARYSECDSAVQTCAWFSADELKNYILYAQYVADSLHLNASGMRVYFGVYPDSDPKKAGKLTVFFSPTELTRAGDGLDKDIEIGSEDDHNLLNFGNMGYPPKAYGDQ